MPTFDFTSLLWWGLPLAAAPVAIHLINLLRHRKVDWAAMEFLLASQRKYRTRVLLRQILLLLLRVAAVVGIVLALAQPRLQTAFGRLLGGGKTTHVILVDDSYSMGDTWGQRLVPDDAEGTDGHTAFAQARRLVERLLERLATDGGDHEVVIGRFSSFRKPPGEPDESAAQPGDLPLEDLSRFDIPRQPLTPQTLPPLRRRIAEFGCSALDDGPQAAVNAAEQVVMAAGGPAVLWLVTDFRVRDWKAAEPVAAALRRLSAADIGIRLVDCGGEAAGDDGDGGANLTIEQVEPVGGVAAVGVLLPMEIVVRNQGDVAAENVRVSLAEDGLERPGLIIESIAAGATARSRFEVRFEGRGSHTVQASLPADRLAADNVRVAAIDVVDRAQVLIIDGGSSRRGEAGDAFYVATALAPGAGAPTGVAPRIESRRSLVTLDLQLFDAVWLLDVERLEADEVRALEAFAAGGGGVVFFVGPTSSPEFINEMLYRKGEGIFPVPLAGAIDLLDDPANRDTPDLVAEEHPVVTVLAGRRNPFLGAVRVDRYMAVARGFEPVVGSGLRRLLSLRDGSPLMVERPFGDGMVVAVLTTASPSWNTWARGNPSWVVVMLELESRLAAGRRRSMAAVVGEEISIRLEPGLDETGVDFILPPDGTLVHVDGGMKPGLKATGVPGGYVARWRRLDGTEQERIIAVNVNPSEGDLNRVSRGQLESSLSGVVHDFRRADAFEPNTGDLAGASLVRPLLHALLVVFLLEQLLAYAVSYHPRTRVAALRR
jgi:hypothetical protein